MGDSNDSSAKRWNSSAGAQRRRGAQERNPQHTAGDFVGRFPPGGPPARDIRLVHLQGQPLVVGVDGDGIPILDQRQQPTLLGLRCDVPDDEAVGSAGETVIGDQGHALAQAHAHDGRGDREHLAHTRSAFRPLVTDDHHLAGFHLAALNAGQGLLFRVVADGRSAELGSLFAGDLGHCALLGQVAVEQKTCFLAHRMHGQDACPSAQGML